MNTHTKPEVRRWARDYIQHIKDEIDAGQSVMKSATPAYVKKTRAAAGVWRCNLAKTPEKESSHPMWVLQVRLA